MAKDRPAAGSILVRAGGRRLAAGDVARFPYTWGRHRTRTRYTHTVPVLVVQGQVQDVVSGLSVCLLRCRSLVRASCSTSTRQERRTSCFSDDCCLFALCTVRSVCLHALCLLLSTHRSLCVLCLQCLIDIWRFLSNGTALYTLCQLVIPSCQWCSGQSVHSGSRRPDRRTCSEWLVGTNERALTTTSVQLKIHNPPGGGRTNSKPICF